MASFDFQYPAGSTGATSTAGVFYHNLSAENEKKLGEVMAWAQAGKVDLLKVNKHALNPKLTVLRFLRANKFDVKKTQKAITGHLAWQDEIKLDELMKRSPESILTCEISAFTDLYPHWHYGNDKTGRPVMYKQYDKFLAGAIKRLTGDTFDNVMKYHIWEQEVSAELCKRQSLKNQAIIETITGVIDIRDMKMAQITQNFLKMVKIMAEVDQKRYPETLGKIFIINAPSAFGTVWAMVKGWVDPVTRERIQVLNGPEEYEPLLKEWIGEENLPANYGGKLPALCEHMHPYSEYLTGVVPCVSAEGAAAAVASRSVSKAAEEERSPAVTPIRELIGDSDDAPISPDSAADAVAKLDMSDSPGPGAGASSTSSEA
jgi:hypothetical protein